MTRAHASAPIVHDGSCHADAIRWRVLRLLQNLDVPALCDEAGIDPHRLKELLADPRPSAELVAWVARFAGIPVAEVIFGPSAEAGADAQLSVLTATPSTDLMLLLAGRLQTLEARIERAMLALLEVETRMSAAGLKPSDLIPPELIPLYAAFSSERGPAGAPA